jgi:hypothetical protein
MSTGGGRKGVKGRRGERGSIRAEGEERGEG